MRRALTFPPTLHVACPADVCGSSRESNRLGRQRWTSKVNWRHGGVVSSKQARRRSSYAGSSCEKLCSAGHVLLTRDCQPLHRIRPSLFASFSSHANALTLPSAHPILPTPSTIATDTRLVALTTCTPLSDRNSQLTRNRAGDCARAITSLS